MDNEERTLEMAVKLDTEIYRLREALVAADRALNSADQNRMGHAQAIIQAALYPKGTEAA